MLVCFSVRFWHLAIENVSQTRREREREEQIKCVGGRREREEVSIKLKMNNPVALKEEEKKTTFWLFLHISLVQSNSELQVVCELQRIFYWLSQNKFPISWSSSLLCANVCMLIIAIDR